MGVRSFERGVEYQAQGRVGALAVYQATITAVVHGTEEYSVRLWVEEGDLVSECTCPMGEEGYFCKHAVAVAREAVASDARARRRDRARGHA